MELKDYQQLALRTCNKELPELSEWEVKSCMLCFGIAGESGELVDLFKKAMFHKHGLDRDKVKGELGDLVWYITNLASHFGISMNEVLQLNIDKLKTRYPNGFTTEDSISRVDIQKEFNFAETKPYADLPRFNLRDDAIQDNLDSIDRDWDEVLENNHLYDNEYMSIKG